MADFDTLGKALQIPDNVIKNIDAIDKKINQIATDSEKMATVFQSAMTRMGTGADGLLKKLQSIQGVINGLGSVNIGGLGSVSKGIGSTATQAEKAAASISQAASALNRFVETWKGSGRVTSMLDSLATREQVNLLRELNNQAMQTSRTLTQANRENALSAKQRANETKIASQEETNATNRKMAALKQENAQIKINSAEYRNYVSALTMSESSENSRLKKIERMNTVLSELQRKEALYSNEIEITRKKIEQLTRENESLARVRDKASKQRTDERTNTQALNAYNRAMAASEALVTQRINKIAKLRQAEEMLRNASGNYATQLNRINQEIARLNKLNQGQVDSYGRVIRSQRNLVNTSQQLTRQLALIFSVSQIEGYISKLIRVRGEFELQQTALASILQNKDQADQLFAQITELAVKSPFTVKELTTYTKSLSAYQVEYEKLYDTTKMLADVSAGLGVDMQRLILAFGQVKAANILRGTEVRQFTEAGLNILGELAKYYSELEGRMISVGEVQDMVTKRMVSFGDVEEVFKRITSAGGIFYNMQERQAETLAGQMSNLQDQIDLMFNEIGKQNQGSLNTAISIIKAVIENWEILANILQSAAIGWTVYAAKTLLAAAANKAFSSSAIVATRDMKGLTGMTAKVITSMRSFFSVLKANPIAIIATVVTSAVIAWNKHKKAVEENIKSYDPMVNSVSRAKEELSDLAEKITEQNEKLNEAVNNVSKYKKGTDEYVTAEISANKEREKQNQLLNELKTKYPEIYTGISKQINGNEELTKVLQEQLVTYGYVLEQQQYLSYLGRQTATGEDNGILKNIQQATEATNATKTASENVDFAYKQMLGRINEFFATNKRVSDSFKDTINGIINSTESADDKISKLLTSIYGFEGSGVFNIGDLRRSIDRTGLEDIVSTYRDAEDLRKKELEELEKDIAYITKEYLRSYDTTTSEGLKNAEEAATEYVKSLNIHNQEVLDFAKQQFEVKLGISIDLKEIPAELGIVEKRINDYLDKNQFNLIERIKPGEGMEKFFKELQDNLKTYKSELEKYQSATGQLSPEFTNEEMIDQYNAKIKQVSETLNYWGYAIKEKNNDSKTELDILKEQIRLIQEAGKEYEKYRKLYDEPMAQQLTEEAFTQAFKDVGLSVDMEFDVNGVIEGIRKVISTAGVEGQKIGNEAIAKLMTDTNAGQRTKEVEEYRKQIDELFTSLENYKELEKLGLNKDLISQLFGIDVSSINDVQSAFDRMKSILKGYGDEGEKLIAEAEKKITQQQQNELNNRLKEYAQMLKKSISERARIELEAQKEIRKVQETSQLDDVQKRTITQSIRVEADKAKDKATWEDFQNTDLYIRMFEDLDSVSTRTLNLMQEKLAELRVSLKNLDPQDLKAISEQMEKINEESISRNPFTGMIDNIKKYIEYRKQANELENKYNKSVSQEDFLKKSIDQQYLAVDAAEKRYLESVKLNGEYSQESILAKTNLNIQKQQLDTLLNQLVAQGKITQELADQIRAGEIFGDNTNKALSDSISLANEFITMLSSMSSDIEQIFGSFSEKGSDAVSSFVDIASSYMQMTQGNANLAMGIMSGNVVQAISGGIQSIQGLFSTIGSLFQIGDKKKERELQRQLELVENLQHAYEKLEKAIDDAYSLDQYQKAYDMSKENLEQQRAALQESIRLEEDKKKTDKDRIKEWEQQIDDIEEQLEELAEEQFSTATAGILDSVLSAADEFTNAWLEAFRETGDGMTGLEENFQEMLENMLKRQAAMTITNTFIENWKKQLERYINEEDMELTTAEAKKWVDSVTSSLPALNEALESYFKAMQDAGFDLTGKGEGDTLTGLSKSISGITETQADALAALCESIRYFTSDSNTVLRSIYNFLLAPPSESPLMQEMKLQTTHLASIDSLLSRLTRNVTSNGLAIKVQIV